MLRLVVAMVILALASPIRAEGTEAVALLPLDAARRLEIYGQPVASELARTLVAGEIDVVVVGAKMAVPDRARLIVDGTITTGKADAVVLTLRIRNPVDGTVLTTMTATAASLASIDQAAAELAARVLPAVRERLVALRPPPAPAPAELGPRAPANPPPPAPKLVLVAISGGRPASPLAEALTAEVAGWVQAHRRELAAIEPVLLHAKVASATVRDRGAELAIAFEIGGFAVARHHGVPLGRARVRVRISDPSGVVFERVVVTDSVVGERALEPAGLAARTAREVLAILRPHLRRAVPSWR